MPRPKGQTKVNMSLAVLPETRQMLFDKSEATGQTVSDLAQIAIVEKYNPRRGLAKRLKQQEDEARLALQHELESIQSGLNSNKYSVANKQDRDIRQAEELANGAKQSAEAKLAKSVQLAEELANEANADLDLKAALLSKQATDRYELITARCKHEWGVSIQKQLSSYDLSKKSDADRLNRWLFDQGIWLTAAWDSKPSTISGVLNPRYFGGRAWHGYASVFLSPVFPDIATALDIAAELTTWTASPEYRHFVLQHYDFDADRMYRAFDSPLGSKELAEFVGWMQLADAAYGTELANLAVGC